MNAADARKLCEQAKAPLPPGMHEGNFEHVRNTRRKIVDSIPFRSTLEANTYQLLKSWEAAGAIRNLKLQPRFVLQEKFKRDGKTVRAMHYTPDFGFDRFVSVPCTKHWKAEAFCEACKRTAAWFPHVIESKGHKTQPYQMRKKLFLAKYPDIRFEEWDRETLKANGG